ncbi:MAG: PepSY domain-containing protein [Tannerellaceae bacterium]|nr:PepSY domain-containing protein [Tannerellaceae bacterium]
MNHTIRKTFIRIHLLTALLCGAVIFVVCITGCLYVFKDEITDLSRPRKFVTPQDKPFILPEKVLDIANNKVTDLAPWAITYGEKNDAILVDYFDREKGMFSAYINPYDGEVIKTTHTSFEEFDFFRFILTGHRTLWLPREIGKPIIGYSVVLFTLTLITGYILWFPRRWNKKTIKRSYLIKRSGSFARFLFDLHTVLGKHVSLILLVLCLTGLIWSFPGFSKVIYSLTSGGEELKPYTLPNSQIPQEESMQKNTLNTLYHQLKAEEPTATTFYFALPQSEEGVIRVSVVHKRGSYYQTDNLFFDRYTLASLEGSGPYAGKYKEASKADKLRRMNLEIHDGRILGLFGKIIMFFVSLTGASLPVTGVYIWYKKDGKYKDKSIFAT